MIPLLWFLWYCRPVRSKKVIATHLMHSGEQKGE